MAESDIELKSSEEIAEFLDDKLKQRFVPFREAFLKQIIDGKCLSILTYDLISAVAPDSPVGDRIFLLSYLEGLKVERDTQVLLEIDDITISQEDTPDVKGKLVLTRTAIKLIHQETKAKKHFVDSKKPELGHTVLTTTVKKVNLIDLRTVLDCDLEEKIDHFKEERGIPESYCLCCTRYTPNVSERKNEVYLSSIVCPTFPFIFD